MPVANQTNLALFYGPTNSDYHVFAYNQLDLIRRDPAFNASRTTAFYAHGYLENLSSPYVQAIVTAYLKRNEQNLVVYDWSKAAGGDYFSNAAPNSAAVSCPSDLIHAVLSTFCKRAAFR